MDLIGEEGEWWAVLGGFDFGPPPEIIYYYGPLPQQFTSMDS